MIMMMMIERAMKRELKAVVVVVDQLLLASV